MAEHQTEHARDQGLCPVCWTTFTPTGRQVYCTETCRKSAWTRRHTRIIDTPTTTVLQRFQAKPTPTYACPRCHESIALTDLLDSKEPPNR